MHKSALAIFDTLPDPAAIIDSSMRIVEINPAFSRSFSTSESNARGTEFCTLVRNGTAWDSQEETDICTAAAELDFDNTTTFEIQCPKNACHYICTISPIEAMKDQPLFLIVLRDISPFKQREESTLQEMRLLEDLLENANDMVQSVDTQGNFLYVNRTWREKMGYSEEEIPHINLRDILSPDCAAKCYSMFAEVMQGKDLGRVETTFIAKDGSKIIVEGNCNCRIENGMPVATRGIFRDITAKKKEELDRKELEQHMQQLQKLESLGLMAGGIAHDFNNLLMGIMGFTELILTRDNSRENILKYAKNIEHAAKRAAKLTNQMLAYSGHGRYRVDYLDLSRVVRESQSLFGATVSRKIQIEYDLENNLPLIEADMDQMRQMIMNIVTNASEAIGDGEGLICLTTGVMEADREYLTSTYINEKLPAGRYIYLRVSDNGPGIEPETIPRIFDPFFTTKFTGRGLGLAAVLGIVRGHKGAIKVDSTPGEGTTITVLLPAYQGIVEQEETQEKCAAAKRAKKEKAVLLVEDEQSVRMVASLIISDLGVKVIEAPDGQEGFNIFCREKEHIGLVITDMLMPGINGMELLHKIRETGSDVPVVLSSGYNKEDVVSSIEEKELAGFIHKPYRQSQMQDIVRSILQLNGGDDADKS